tara:strand:+ start:1191 stop:1475 length:285 start_codon:yes stop_codon:yes gene_type:complete
MINSIYVRDINSINIQEDSNGRINFVFKSEDDYIDIDCDIPASLSMIISSDRDIEDSTLLYTLLEAAEEAKEIHLDPKSTAKKVRKFGYAHKYS